MATPWLSQGGHMVTMSKHTACLLSECVGGGVDRRRESSRRRRRRAHIGGQKEEPRGGLPKSSVLTSLPATDISAERSG